MADFEKIENEYELEKMNKVGWTSGQKFYAKLVMKINSLSLLLVLVIYSIKIIKKYINIILNLFFKFFPLVHFWILTAFYLTLMHILLLIFCAKSLSLFLFLIHDFEKIENEYELEKMYKVRWTSGQKFFAK